MITAAESLVRIVMRSKFKSRKAEEMLTPTYGPNMLLELHRFREQDLFAEADRSRFQHAGHGVPALNRTDGRHRPDIAALARVIGAILPFWTNRV